MSPNVSLSTVAAALGLDLQTADIYASILAHGAITKDDLQLLLDLPAGSVIASLTHLLAKDLVYHTSVNERDEFRAADLYSLPPSLSHNSVLMRELESLLPPTLRLSQKLGIVKYEGLSGIRKVYLEVLEEAEKCGEPILAFERGLDAASLGTAFVEKYVQRRIDAGIEAYVLSPATTKDREYKKQYEGSLTHVKLLPDFDIKANINVVGDLVMSFDLDLPQGTLRRDKAEAQTVKTLFRELWKRSA